LSKQYKKEKQPLKYKIAFDGVKCNKDEQMFLWRQLIKTLTELHQQAIQN